MANEIKYQIVFSATKGFLSYATDTTRLTADMAGTVATAGAQSVGTSAEAIVMNDVATAGWAYFRNLDATNNVEIGTGTAGSFVGFAKLKPGEAALIRLGTNAPTARSSASTVVLQYQIMAD